MVAGELANALTAVARLLLVLGLPLAVVVLALVIATRFRTAPYSSALRPWFKLMATVQAIGAAIVVVIDLLGLLTAPWQFRYLATFPEVFIFLVPLGALTAPLWLLVFRRLEPSRPLSVVPRDPPESAARTTSIDAAATPSKP